MVPPVLIAVSSILIDASSRPELYQERIWSVLILLLAASFQKSSDVTVLLWSTITFSFFCTISSCAYQAYALRYKWFALDKPDFSRMLAPASIVPLAFCCFKTSYTRTEDVELIWRSCILFLVSFVGLCAFRWHSKRSQDVQQELIGMPTIASKCNFTVLQRPLHEHKWHEWSPSEVLRWISSLDQTWKYRVCGMLAPELIDGSVLDALTLIDLRSMRLTYGDARRLLDEIDALVDKYPLRTPRRSYTAEQQTLDVEGWNMGDDSRFLMQPPMMEEDVISPAMSFSPDPTHDTHPEMSKRMVQKAKKIMMEKYGLELPEINTSADVYDPQPMHAEPEIATVDISHLTALPPGFLEAMPPHIYQIASQKPELIQKLIESHQRKANPPENVQSTQLRTRIQEKQLKTSGELDDNQTEKSVTEGKGDTATGVFATNMSEQDLNDDELFDNEKTGLLRKRGSKFPFNQQWSP